MPRKISKTGRKIRTVRRRAARKSQVDEHLPPYAGGYESIQKQVYQEYNLDWNYMRPKIQKWLVRLKLYNNQRRDEEKVGDPLLYETHQTVLSILYGDKLGVEFKGRLEGEQDQADNLNILAENDYEEMEKDQHDYEWDFDSSFFGSGLSLMNDFDSETKNPIPTIIDPTTFIRNPGAVSVNGNRAGEGAMLHGGYEVKLTESMMQSNLRTDANPDGYFNLDQLEKTNDLFSLSGETRRLRREAQGLNDLFTFENSVETNYEYSILRWFTHLPDKDTGITKKYIVEMANNRMLPIRLIELKKNYWPIIQRKFSPISHDWDGVSVPDLIEDKQRYKAKMLNTAGDIAQADLNGMYLFHEDRFRKTQDFNFKFNKWIPVKGTGSLQDAAAPLQTKQVSQTVKYILDYLDSSAQKATATPDIQQGQPAKGDPTLGELNIQTSGVSTRHSLTAKIWGWSEREFWRHWYFNYEENFEDGLGEKIATLEGPFGTKWLSLKKKGFITGNTLGPKITIESKSVSEAQKTRLYQMMQGYVQILAADPTITFDKTYTYRKMGRLIMPKQEVERVMPLTVDEQQALDENKKLNDEEMPKVLLAQDHNVHLRVHASADDNPTTRRHIQIHRYMLMQKRMNPQSFPQLPGDPQPLEQGGNAAPVQSISPQPQAAAATAPQMQ